MRISDWSSDVCSSDLLAMVGILAGGFIGSWLSNRSPHYALRMLAIIFFVTLFSQVGALLVDSYALFLVLVAIPSLLSARSQARRVGKACVCTCRSRCSPYH